MGAERGGSADLSGADIITTKEGRGDELPSAVAEGKTRGLVEHPSGKGDELRCGIGLAAPICVPMGGKRAGFFKGSVERADKVAAVFGFHVRAYSTRRESVREKRRQPGAVPMC